MELSNVARLYVPSGKVWDVKVWKDNGKTWFQDGMQEFMEYNSISEWHVLVFRYDGNSQFHVVIFNKSASEIEYPCDPEDLEETDNENECPEHTEEGSEEDNSVEIIDVPRHFQTWGGSLKEVINENHNIAILQRRISLRPIGTKKSTTTDANSRAYKKRYLDSIRPERPSFKPTCPGKCKMKQGECEGMTESLVGRNELFEVKQGESEELDVALEKITEVTSIISDCPSDDEQNKKKLKRSAKNEDEAHKGTKSGGMAKRSVSTSTNERVIAAARTFRSQNPHCMVIMRPSYVTQYFSMYKSFLLKLQGLPNGFLRRHLKDNVQIVTLSDLEGRTWPVRRPLNRAKLGIGWKNFVIDKHLEEDDVCVFELVNRQRNELKVIIFRVIEYKLKNNRKMAETDNDTDSYKKKNRSTFTNFVIPSSNSNEKKRGEETGNTDIAGYETNETKQKESEDLDFITEIDGKVLSGKSPFPSYDELGGKKLVKYKRNIDGPHYSKQESRNYKPEAICRRLVSTEEKERTIASGKAFSSENPFCMIVMKPSYVTNTYLLNLPRDFAQKYLRKQFGSVILCGSEGRTWNVQCSISDPLKLTSGWKKFVVDNHLKENDVCVFELVKKNHNELKVFIFRVVEEMARLSHGEELSGVRK
ncbi:hypothetical protein GIB67_015953 [Kingdonia uniflora]|uniref:TF-B3 domain-containing protein n=1 Tax=Kingdonia uniflora TaxID=39325 RepID=A0A7J7PDH6_9MAGN|nr:hypothetical protein GIB67_015953 [Kingdonia uniflora]